MTRRSSLHSSLLQLVLALGSMGLDPIRLSIVNYALGDPLNAKELELDLRNKIVVYPRVLRALEELRSEGLLLRERKVTRGLSHYVYKPPHEGSRPKELSPKLKRLLQLYLRTLDKDLRDLLDAIIGCSSGSGLKGIVLILDYESEVI